MLGRSLVIGPDGTESKAKFHIDSGWPGHVEGPIAPEPRYYRRREDR